MKEKMENTMRESIQQEKNCPAMGGAAARQMNRRKSFKTFAALVSACAVIAGVFGFGGAALALRSNAAAEHVSAVRTVKSSAPVMQQVSMLKDVTSTSGDDLTYAEAAAVVKDSVVEINTEYTVRNSWFQYAAGGAGSGVILSDDGYIITNAHVILDENMRNPADTITVRLTDGTEYRAAIVNYDAYEDIALLKIEAVGLTPAHIGDSDELVVGEEVLVVGNPLGELGGSVTNGIISATEREIEVEDTTMTLLQTNAAVNPGNSGGGMFNLKGELVGIVNAKSSGSGIEGIGFAIPANHAVSVAEKLMDSDYVSEKQGSRSDSGGKRNDRYGRYGEDWQLPDASDDYFGSYGDDYGYDWGLPDESGDSFGGYGDDYYDDWQLPDYFGDLFGGLAGLFGGR